MYEPFSTNYVWNLSVNLAIEMGGAIGDIDGANRIVQEAALRGDGGSAAFFDAWVALAHRTRKQAVADEAAGRTLSASVKYRRAAAYLITAERMQARDFPARKEAYRDALDCFGRYTQLSRSPSEAVRIPYEGSSFPALYTPPPVSGGQPGPCMVFANGLDSIKEMVHLCGVADALRSRGIGSLIVDQPGVGGALREDGLAAVIDSERWAGAAVDWLETRSEIDPKRIGMMGWSLGGYYAPRAAAFEKRFALCVAWGANHEWGLVQQARRRREGENPVPHYWDHVCWVWGQPDTETFLEFSRAITLTGVVERITVPFLVVHGANDRQIPLEYAYRSHEQATASPRADLRIFTEVEGGIEHCSADNMEPVRAFVADWIAEQFNDHQKGERNV